MKSRKIVNAFGKIPGDVMEDVIPPEDWQFENTKWTKIDGKKKEQNPPEFDAEAFLKRLPPEVAKEEEKVETKFSDLPREKKLKLVADEYNSEKSVTRIADDFGIGRGTLYEHIKEAKEIGLIENLRSEENTQEPSLKEDVEVDFEPKPCKKLEISSEDFVKEAAFWQKETTRLEGKIANLIDAGEIAKQLEELLGSEAQDLINGLYVRVV